jgi:hypothetical protein
MKRRTLPISQLALWAEANGVQYHGVTVRPQAEDGDSGLDRGFAVFAEQDIAAASDDEPVCLMIVPSHLVLSLAAVRAQAEHDHHLKELLDATGELAEVREPWAIYWGLSSLESRSNILLLLAIRPLGQQFFSTFFCR